MRLKATILKNFRQYPYAVILFPPNGFIGIIGKNGRGKSTIFNSLSYAFYGKIKDVLKDDIKYTGAGKREDCYVMHIFEHLGEDYVIKRHLTKVDESFLKPLKGGAPLVNKGPAALTNYITDTFFKMDYQSFCSCYYAQQKDFDALSKLTPGKRRETLTRLLRIDSIDKAIEIVNKEIKDDTELLHALERELEKEQTHLDAIAEAKISIEKHKELITQTSQLIEDMKKRYDELSNQQKEGEKDYQIFLQLRQEYKEKLQKFKMLDERIIKDDTERLNRLLKDEVRFDSIKSSIDEYSALLEEKEEASKMRALYQEKASLASQIKSIGNEVESFRSEYKELQQSIKNEDSLRSKLNEVANNKNSLFEEVQEKTKQVQELNFEIRKLKDDLQKLKETKEKYESLGKDSPCPMCERPLGEHFDNTMEHLRSEQQPLLEGGRKIQETRDKLNVEIEGFKKDYEQFVLKEQELLAFIQEIDKKKSRMMFIQEQVQSLNEKYQHIIPRYQELKDVQFDNQSYLQLEASIKKTKVLYDDAISIQGSLKDIPVLREKIKNNTEEKEFLQENMKSIHKKVDALGFDEEAYKKLTSSILEMQKNIHEQQENVTKYQYLIKTDEQRITYANEQLAKIANTKIKITERKNELAGNLFLVDAYKAYKQDIIASLVPDLSVIMSEDIDLITGGFYDQVELDKDFNIFMYRLGERKPLSFYSGGEQDLAALVQLLGVSHLLSEQTGQASLEMVAMDEVVSSFDDERQVKTIEQLRNLKEIFPQILMVAHQDSVKELFDHTLVVTINDKRESQVEWLHEWDDSEIRELVEPYVEV